MDTKNQINIFIVEDNEIFRMALKSDIENTFPKAPIKIHLFDTGESCMDRFVREMPELVILDYHLNSKFPNAADGIKVLDWIKKESPETNVIILTSDDHIDIAVKSLKHGASDYVVKTETKFKKINYSVLNMFKIIEARRGAKKYKNLAIGFCLCFALMIAGVFIIQLFYPTILR
ncbi:MAG: hypothetical protein A3F72_05930 [Bacteroidetes bacterium RIFCSPLOWO2_12_FULL_35_15]|nr:MAG: hypothetical protein A3F72_05930 [Bacteroidetes bacterium RIFCSPLOWO2_12_FULL_35_15]